jgi:hypothetical protein
MADLVFPQSQMTCSNHSDFDPPDLSPPVLPVSDGVRCVGIGDISIESISAEAMPTRMSRIISISALWRSTSVFGCSMIS